jgi:hypothetical protein
MFLKHDFAAYVYKVVSSADTLPFHFVFGLNNHRPTVSSPILDGHTSDSTAQTTKYEYIGGGRRLVFSSEELDQYTLTNMVEKQYKFIHCLSKDKAQARTSSDSTLIICDIPISVLAPRLTFKHIKELALLHSVHISARLKVSNAQMLLQSHVCQTCGLFVAILEPYQPPSNTR